MRNGGGFIKMEQKSGIGKNGTLFLYAARLIFDKEKIEKSITIISIIRIMLSSKMEKRLYSHMGTYLLDDKYECIKRLTG
jgi:hypothetical protein